MRRAVWVGFLLFLEGFEVQGVSDQVRGLGFIRPKGPETRTHYFQTLNKRTRGADNEYRGGPGGPGTGFCNPGGGFSGSRRSGKPLCLLPLKPTPGLQKPVPGPPEPPRDLLLAPPGDDF